jgi:hypothetical protein
MRMIYKYPLSASVNKQSIEVPLRSKVISIKIQQNIPVIYVEQDRDPKFEFKEIINIKLVPTGGVVPTNYKFVDTLMFYDGSYVLHAYVCIGDIV